MKLFYEKIYVFSLLLSVLSCLLFIVESDFNTMKLELNAGDSNNILRRSFHNVRNSGKRGITHVIRKWKVLSHSSILENYYDVESAIRFRYHKNGEKVYESSNDYQSLPKRSGCTPEDKFAFILHGWKQNCDTEWVIKLTERLTFHRGGCIICIDYGVLAQASYMGLYRGFRRISSIIAKRILGLIKDGMNPNNGYIFGFSFGGQLATSIGRILSPKYMFKSIDTCDMAGPGFDIITDVDHREAAQNVQCLHSSRDKGTSVYSCHQSVRLGSCGHYQPAAVSQPYYSSHGLCVQIYINAFDYPFYAMQKKPHWCSSTKTAANVPYKYTIGYRENPNLNVRGEIFVPTSLNFPYNLSDREKTAVN